MDRPNKQNPMLKVEETNGTFVKMYSCELDYRGREGHIM